MNGKLDCVILTPGKLTSVFFRELTRESSSLPQLTSTDQPPSLYRLTVHTDPHDSARPLAITHLPSLAVKDAEVADRAMRTDLLSIERLLVHTIYLRTKARLAELKQELQTLLRDIECELQIIQISAIFFFFFFKFHEHQICFWGPYHVTDIMVDTFLLDAVDK